MVHDTPTLKLRAAFAPILIALASVGTALSTLLIASVAIKITLLVIAASLLVATGASLATLVARAKPTCDE